MPYYYRLPGGPIYTIYRDMLDQTHLMIAGATGSGKSTVLNAIICTALHYPPSEKQFIFLDRKGVELDAFRAAPHCIGYAETSADMIQTLKKCIEIMDQRLQEMKRQGVKVYPGSDIYIVIDELADLMTTQKKTVTPLLQELGILARAAKIHLICCTQSPLRNIIPTEIKCNFPARVALKTATRQDSRNIIDQAGAELLPDPQTEHRASCIYRRGATTTLYNDIPRIDDEERDRLIEHWRTAHKHFCNVPIRHKAGA
ncbi:MAG: DNA translocase FtsK [Clostridia bacterium]|nr:DNA translocase FtsK [Clostridia bacterium]